MPAFKNKNATSGVIIWEHLDIILTTNPSLHKRSGVIKKTLSDHYVIFTELFLLKKTPHDIHNTVTFRNYSHFEESEFINDVQSNDFFEWTL